MIIQVTAIKKEEQGPDIEFNCPVCGASTIIGETYETTEIAKLFFFIPILKLRNTRIQCSNCGKSVVCTSPLSKIHQYTKDEIQNFIRYYPSNFGKILSVLSFILCLIPFFNIFLPLIALFIVRGTQGWPKFLAKFSLIIGGTVTLVSAIIFVCEQSGVSL